MKKALFIEGIHNGHNPVQCGSTMTIRDLIDWLEETASVLGDDAPVYLRNDNGYTYGSINDYYFNTGKFDNDHAELDEEWCGCIYDREVD